MLLDFIEFDGKSYKLFQGNMLYMRAVIDANSIDSIVTDPPYELNFMNKGWDNSGIAFQVDTWKKCYEVLKPGGYLLAFGGSRTFHRIACAIEDAGFEIRDTIMWVYGSGFPKSMNLGKAIESKLVNGSANTQAFKHLEGTKEAAKSLGIVKRNAELGYKSRDYGADGHERTVKVEYKTEEGEKWDGWGTALKPSYEPIIVARKPCEGSCVDNVLKYGVGGINIDECRIETTEKLQTSTSNLSKYGGNGIYLKSKTKNVPSTQNENGRFPSNTILTYDETDYEEVCGGMPVGGHNGSIVNPNLKNSLGNNGIYGKYSEKQPLWEAYNDSGSASRYFYCAKASKRDRNEGINTFKNNHPTVKPTSLMQYLVRLVTPKGGTILDPFNGSGSTGKAVMYENNDRDADYKYIGIELTEEYIPISRARIEYASGNKTIIEPEVKTHDLNDIEIPGQMSIFDYL